MMSGREQVVAHERSPVAGQYQPGEVVHDEQRHAAQVTSWQRSEVG
jgi:hypothetical protein